MSKVDIKTLDSVTTNDTAATALINDNFKELQDAIENTLSRDGTTPNFMDADLDMNSYRIINSADPVEDNDIVNLKYVNERIGGAAEAAAEAKASASQAASSAQTALVSAANALNSANNAYTYSQEAKAAAEDENVIAVGTDLRKGDASAIKITSESIDNVNAVGSNIASVNTAAEIKDSINTVAADKDNVDTVAGSIENVNKTGASIDNVNKVAPHVEALETVAPDIMDVVTVAGIADKVSNVSDNMNHVVAVDNNAENINKAVANEANITTAANNITNINTVAADITNVDQVVANKDNIDNVSANISDVKNVSANMQDVKDAVVSAGLAKSWAIGDIASRPEGSSKYWAQQAQAAAQIGDATEEQKGWARLATAAEAQAGTDDTTIMTPLKTASVATDNVGRGIQLGFNGTLAGDTITFVPDQSAYTIKHGYDYEIDLLFAAVGSIPDTTKLVISNGEDTVQIVNVKHSDFNSPITYADMKQVCRYDNEIGWRWVFNARFSVTDSGVKVMVMPSTVVSIPENIVTTDTAQNITAGKNFINSATSNTTDAHTGMSISLQNNQADLTANTTNDDGSVDFKYQGIRMLDKNGEEMSFLYSAPDGVGGSFTRLGTSSKVDGQYVDSFVELEVDANGKSHFYVPDVDEDSTVSGNQAATVEWVKASSLPAQAGNAGKFLKTDGTAASWADVGGGLEIGDIGFAPLGIDETQNRRRYLNGQVISQSQFATFTDKVKAAIALYPNLSATEANWQAEVTNSKLGQCGKFVIDDDAGTIRLPCVVNINGLVDLANCGVVKSESLPNITGGGTWIHASGTGYGVFYSETGTINQNASGTGSEAYNDVYFNASRSSSTYQNNAPVQQEAVQYPYFIQVATSSEDDVDITNEIQLNNPFSLFESKYSADTIINASWLISNGTFHSGATYVTAYQALVVENNAEVAVGATVTLPNGSSYTKRGLSVKLSTDTYDDYDYVLNTTDTTFRLPIKVKLASGNAVAGNGMTLGLTDGTNNAGLVNVSNIGLSSRINVYGSTTGIQNSGNSMDTYVSWGVTTDPTKSGIETSSQGLKLYFYVGETIQDANVIAASGVLTKVANSIDRTVATDRETVVGWGMPDYSAGVSFPIPYNNPYTADSNGLVVGYIEVGSGYYNNVFVNGQAVQLHYSVSFGTIFPVSKGDIVTTDAANGSFTFYPCKGV